jgi:hypothetical protein
MIKDILQIIIAAGLLVASMFTLLRFVKYRKTHAEMLVVLYNNLGEENNFLKR